MVAVKAITDAEEVLQEFAAIDDDTRMHFLLFHPKLYYALARLKNKIELRYFSHRDSESSNQSGQAKATRA